NVTSLRCLYSTTLERPDTLLQFTDAGHSRLDDRLNDLLNLTSAEAVRSRLSHLGLRFSWARQHDRFAAAERSFVLARGSGNGLSQESGPKTHSIARSHR